MKNLSNNFGSKKVSKSQKTKLVQEVFDNVAERYDLMNDLMSLGFHKLWKKRLVELINIQNNQKIIDVGSGTGDIGQMLSNKDTSADIYLGDLNIDMLRNGKKKFYNKKNIKLIKLNAENLPFQDNYFDKYVISFCLRNVTNMEKALKESFRVLKEGGEFFCLEFSTANIPIVNFFYDKYKKNIIPKLGEIITSQKDAYQYLAESINIFPDQEMIIKELKKVGYIKTSYYNIFNGIVAIHKGWKI